MVLGLASIIALVAIVHRLNYENGHPLSQVCRADSRLLADLVPVKRPCYGEGQVARVDDARELCKVTLVHHLFGEGKLADLRWFWKMINENKLREKNRKEAIFL